MRARKHLLREEEELVGLVEALAGKEEIGAAAGHNNTAVWSEEG